jgi:hypothetical protein
VLAVNAFYFTESFVIGISIALAFSIAPTKGSRFVLGVSSVLLIGTNFIVIAHLEFIHFVATVRGFSMANGLLLEFQFP